MTERENRPYLPPAIPMYITEANTQTHGEKPVSSSSMPVRGLIDKTLVALYNDELATQEEPEKGRLITAENVLSSQEMREVYEACHDKEAFDGCT